MKPFPVCILATVALLLVGCGSKEVGRYLPVSSNNAVLLVDTSTGQMYGLPPQYRSGSDPTPPAPSKWKLVAQF